MLHGLMQPNFGRLYMQVPDILFSSLSNIQGKGNVAHVQPTFHVRIMVGICFVLVFASANTFLFMKMLDFSENYYSMTIRPLSRALHAISEQICQQTIFY